MKKIQLSVIAEIQLGHSFRSKIEEDHDGDVYVIQQRNIIQADTPAFDAHDVFRVSGHSISNLRSSLLQNNDLMFRSRGNVPKSVQFCLEPPLRQPQKKYILAAPLLRIRVQSNTILPDFLNWYLNSPAAQVVYAREQKGQTARFIDKRVLSQIEVPVMPIQKQQEVVKLAQMMQKEQDITTQLAEIRNTYYNSSLQAIIHSP